MSRVTEILGAIHSELQESCRPTTLTVADRSVNQSIWTLLIDSPGKLNTTQEGWKAWWPSGTASVVSVVPDEGLLHLNFATAAPPSPGEVIRLYPPRFLEELQELWKCPTLAEAALSWLDSVGSMETKVDESELGSADFPWLRTGQRNAFRLASLRCGFLWGPPGTGKTRTIGAILAQYLAQFPTARILLLSTTNSAVDQAILSVDRSVEELIAKDSRASRLKGEYLRMGVHFTANSYLGREHILPTTDRPILAELAQLEDLRPSPSCARDYATWKERIQSVRKNIPRDLAQARLLAITTTEAVLKFDELRNLGKFDLMVFDEASQVGRAHALMLVTLAHRVIFGGDPKQLSPITQSRNAPLVEKWLGTSMFDHMGSESPSMCFLNEQSRMAKPICKVVSAVFYKQELVVARDCANSDWIRDRTPAYVDGYGELPLIIPDIHAEGLFSPNYGGWIRHESATVIASIVDRMLTCADMTGDKILIITPYHSQNQLIRQKVNANRRIPIRVRTVHSVQGQECHTVIFDPVNGHAGLNHGIESARLISVAISRAQACLVVPMSSGDLSNPELKKIYESAAGTAVPTAVAEGTPLFELALIPGFPRSCMGKLVVVKENGENFVGELVQITPDRSAFFIKPNVGSRPRVRFNTAAVLSRARHAVPLGTHSRTA